jgi:hypothetical protein
MSRQVKGKPDECRRAARNGCVIDEGGEASQAFVQRPDAGHHNEFPQLETRRQVCRSEGPIYGSRPVADSSRI